MIAAISLRHSRSFGAVRFLVLSNDVCLDCHDFDISSAIDQPHNTNGLESIECGNCHILAGDTTSPDWKTPDASDPDDSDNNRRCLQCHGGTVANIPAAVGAFLKYHGEHQVGWWMVGGMHRVPQSHYQLQSRRGGAASYLATGTIALIGPYNAPFNKTPIT